MKRNARLAAERLTKVLIADKISHPERLNDILKSDLYELLSNYFELYPETLELHLSQAENSLNINVNVRAERVKNFGNFRD